MNLACGSLLVLPASSDTKVWSLQRQAIPGSNGLSAQHNAEVNRTFSGIKSQYQCRDYRLCEIFKAIPKYSH